MGVFDDPQGFMRKIAARGLENQKTNPGDYVDEEGFLVCGVCKERRQQNITLPTVTADGQETTMTMKVVCVVPVALLFSACTEPSEFAASLARIGVSYRAGYAVSLALRYIPDVQREYQNISQAQQARGIDLSSKDKFFTRLKNSVAILLPLVMSSLNRIETVSNAMELRGFGKEKKRTWYVQRRLKRNDWLVIGFALVILVVDLVVTFWDGSRFFNPFL